MCYEKDIVGMRNGELDSLTKEECTHKTVEEAYVCLRDGGNTTCYQQRPGKTSGYL